MRKLEDQLLKVTVEINKRIIYLEKQKQDIINTMDNTNEDSIANCKVALDDIEDQINSLKYSLKEIKK